MGSGGRCGKEDSLKDLPKVTLIWMFKDIRWLAGDRLTLRNREMPRLDMHLHSTARLRFEI